MGSFLDIISGRSYFHYTNYFQFYNAHVFSYSKYQLLQEFSICNQCEFRFINKGGFLKAKYTRYLISYSFAHLVRTRPNSDKTLKIAFSLVASDSPYKTKQKTKQKNKPTEQTKRTNPPQQTSLPSPLSPQKNPTGSWVLALDLLTQFWGIRVQELVL